MISFIFLKGKRCLKKTVVPTLFQDHQVSSSLWVVKRRILVSSDTEVRQPSFSYTSAADYSNATVTENANGNIPLGIDIYQADTAVTVDTCRPDHCCSAPASKRPLLGWTEEDHSYNLRSPKSLKQTNQAIEDTLKKYRRKLKGQCQKSRRFK